MTGWVCNCPIKFSLPSTRIVSEFKPSIFVQQVLVVDTHHLPTYYLGLLVQLISNSTYRIDDRSSRLIVSVLRVYLLSRPSVTHPSGIICLTIYIKLLALLFGFIIIIIMTISSTTTNLNPIFINNGCHHNKY